METFSALLAICAGNSPVMGEFPTQRPVRRSFDVSFDLRLNKRLSTQSWGWCFETLSCPLWRHSNELHQNAKHTGAETKWTLFSWRHFQMHFLFRLISQWGLFLRVQLTISNIAGPAPSHYLNQCWPSSLTHIWDIRPQGVSYTNRPFAWKCLHQFRTDLDLCSHCCRWLSCLIAAMIFGSFSFSILFITI